MLQHIESITSLLSADRTSRLTIRNALSSEARAFRSASDEGSLFQDTWHWYIRYIRALEQEGWVTDKLNYPVFKIHEGKFSVDVRALARIIRALTATGLDDLKSVLDGLQENNENGLVIFSVAEFLGHQFTFDKGSFSLDGNGQAVLTVGIIQFEVDYEKRTRLVVFDKTVHNTDMWMITHEMRHVPLD